MEESREEISRLENMADLQYSAFIENFGTFARRVSALHEQLCESRPHFPLASQITPISAHINGLCSAAFAFDGTMVNLRELQREIEISDK